MTPAQDFQVAVTEDDGVWRASIRETTSGRVVRQLEDRHASCQGLLGAVAFTLTLLRDATPARRAPLTVATTPPPLPPPAVLVRVGARVESAVLVGLGGPTQATFGGAFKLALAGAWAMEVGGVYAVPVTTQVATGRASLSLACGTLGACFEPPFVGDWLRGALCGSLWLGALNASATGFEDSASTRRIFAAVLTSAGLNGRITRHLDWTARASLVVPLRRDTFVIDGYGAVFTPAPVGFAASLGLSVWFL